MGVLGIDDILILGAFTITAARRREFLSIFYARVGRPLFLSPHFSMYNTMITMDH